MIGDDSPATRRAAAQVVVDLLNYRELFTADRLPAGLRPWGGASASAVAEMRSGREETRPRQCPGRAAAAAGRRALRGDHPRSHAVSWPPSFARQPPCGHGHRSGQANVPRRNLTHLPPVLDRHRRDHDPLPELTSFLVRKRLANGWIPVTRCSRSISTASPGKQGTGVRLPVAAGLRAADRGGLAQAGVAALFGGTRHRAQANGQMRCRGPFRCTATKPKAWSASSAPPRSS